VIIFSVQLNWLPAVGAGPGGAPAHGDGDWEHIRYLILPAITTSVIPMGIVTRTVRALTGGYPVHRIFVEAFARQGLARNPRFPARHQERRADGRWRVMGLQLGYMPRRLDPDRKPCFSWPGSGLFAQFGHFSSAICRCWQGTILVLALFFVFLNLMVDIAAGPRSIRASSGAEAYEHQPDQRDKSGPRPCRRAPRPTRRAATGPRVGPPHHPRQGPAVVCACILIAIFSFCAVCVLAGAGRSLSGPR